MSNPPMHNYIRKIVKMVTEGKLSLSVGLANIYIYHDDWCAINGGGWCDCDPDIEYKPPQSNETTTRRP